MSKALVLDTNVCIRGFLSNRGGAHQVLEYALRRRLAVFSEQTLQELYSTLLRPKFQRYTSRDLVEVFLLRCRIDGQLVAVSESIRVCRDPDDDHFLALAYSASADWLLTYDEDLLVLDPFRHRAATIRIQRTEAFLTSVSLEA